MCLLLLFLLGFNVELLLLSFILCMFYFFCEFFSVLSMREFMMLLGFFIFSFSGMMLFRIKFSWFNFEDIKSGCMLGGWFFWNGILIKFRSLFSDMIFRMLMMCRVFVFMTVYQLRRFLEFEGNFMKYICWVSTKMLFFIIIFLWLFLMSLNRGWVRILFLLLN